MRVLLHTFDLPEWREQSMAVVGHRETMKKYGCTSVGGSCRKWKPLPQICVSMSRQFSLASIPCPVRNGRLGGFYSQWFPLRWLGRKSGNHNSSFHLWSSRGAALQLVVLKGFCCPEIYHANLLLVKLGHATTCEQCIGASITHRLQTDWSGRGLI